MEITMRTKEVIAAKLRELEDLKSKLPSSRDKKYGIIQHNDPVALWEKIEALEEEIQRLKK